MLGPASSPWVTAVGATRFVGQKVGNEEMATDQFGSGGGFSKMFTQDDAKWQSKAVAKYLSTVDASTLPPAASYNAMGQLNHCCTTVHHKSAREH